MGKAFQGLERKLSGVCESLWILWSSERLGKTVSLSVRNCISQDQTVVKKQNKKKHCAKSWRMHFLSVLTARVHWPLAVVRVTPLYWMCGRVAYLHVAFLHCIAKVCEKFVNFERIFFWYEPCTVCWQGCLSNHIYLFFTVPIVKSECLAKDFKVGGRMG